MARLPTTLETTARLIAVETAKVLDPPLVREFKIPFEMDGTIFYWLWDNGDFILWDNGDRMRQ